MSNTPGFTVKLLTRLILGTIFVAGGRAALAQDPVNLGTIQVTGSGISNDQASAPYQAPTQAPLSATEPQSDISQQYIQQNVAATANYTDIVQISPSVVDVDPNGPGLMESQGLSMRGFQDGQYNVTFDGIPWGDSNDFTHHSTSYFMPQDIGGINVKRGPGNASNIGYATFGGTIALTSKEPLANNALTPYLTIGSFNTTIEGLEYDSGAPKNQNDATAFMDYKQVDSNGYLNYASQKRNNWFFKLLKPISDSSVLSVVAMQQDLHQNTSIGATQAQINQYGPTFALNANPSSQAYYGYNYDDIKSDFEYIGLASNLGSVKLDNKLYTYGYNHHGFNGEDPNGETPNGTFYSPSDVPGQKMAMIYRSGGDILRLTQALGSGDLKYGMWLDNQRNTRWQYEIDASNGGALNPPNATATDRDMYDTLLTMQPYVEYAWKITDALTLTPGLKYSYFRRSINASVNQGSGGPLDYSQSWTKALPALTAHYTINRNWATYAQVAEGFLAPNLNIFYTTNPAASSVNPEQTTNTQLGTTWKSDRLTTSGDLYYIDFNNKIASRTIAGTTIFFNEGGAIYQGAEGEATYYVGQGFSLYGNLSYNSAKEKTTNLTLPNAPKTTGAAGVIYNSGSYYASLLDKYVGSRYGDTGETQPLSSYSVANLALNYKMSNMGALKDAKVGFLVNNLANKTDIYALAGYTGGANTPLYWTLPGRNYELTLAASF